ncbi:MAG TPA: FlgO family outer membrane protein [Thermoanaerobaculia bacterium]
MRDARNFLLALCCVGLWLSQPAAGYQNEIDQTARAIVEKVQTSNTITIAVVDFTDLKGNVTELGRFLAEELSSALAETGGLRVIDRIHLRSLLQEHKLAASGVIDPATARRLGQIAGVQALVTGTITEFGDSVRLTAKVLDTATAQIQASVRTDIPKTDAVKDLLGRGVDTGSGSGFSQSTPEPTKPPTIQSQQAQEVEEFSFQLQRCDVDGADIVCHWAITNKDPEDRDFAFSDRCETVLYDNLSREYSPSRWQIGASSDESEVHKTLLSRVPTPASIRFKLLSSAGFHTGPRSPDSITAVKVSFELNMRRIGTSVRVVGRSCRGVTFHSIPLRAGR